MQCDGKDIIDVSFYIYIESNGTDTCIGRITFVIHVFSYFIRKFR